MLSVCRASVRLAAECAEVQAEKEHIRGRLAAQRYWESQRRTLLEVFGNMSGCPRSKKFRTGAWSKVAKLCRGVAAMIGSMGQVVEALLMLTG